MDNDIETADAYHNGGNTLYEQGHLDGALQMHNHALTIRREIFGNDHEDTVRSYMILGYLYEEVGEVNDALRMYRGSLRSHINESGHGSECMFRVMHLCNKIAYLMHDKQEFFIAMVMYCKALAIQHILGADSSPLDTAEIYVGIGLALHYQGDNTTALAMYEEALRLRVAELGQEDYLIHDTVQDMRTIAASSQLFPEENQEEIIQDMIELIELFVRQMDTEAGSWIAGIVDSVDFVLENTSIDDDDL